MTEESDVSEIPPPPGTGPSLPPPLPSDAKPPLPPETPKTEPKQPKPLLETPVQSPAGNTSANWLNFYSLPNVFNNFNLPYLQQPFGWYPNIQQFPPLPPGPPPNGPRFQNKPIRFQLNGKRPMNPNQMNNSPNSGSAKKKRKRNRNNNQNNQQNNQFNRNNNSQFSLNNYNNSFQAATPPLPPPESPKPQPPPETLPPLPPPTLPESVPLPKEEKKPESEVKSASEQQQSQQGGASGATGAPDDWPESLKEYVHNCYAKCKTNFDKNQVEIILKGKITQAYQTGQLHKDWTKEPLPNIFSDTNPINTQPNGFGKFTGQAKMVTGQLAQYQNNSSKNKKGGGGLSASLGARLGSRSSLKGGRGGSPSRSRSPRKRSKSRSPKRHRSSSSSEEEAFIPLTPNQSSKGKKSSKLAGRLGPHNASNTSGGTKKSKKQKAKEKKAAFYGGFGHELEENNELLEKRAARFSKGGTSRQGTAGGSPSNAPSRPSVHERLSCASDENATADFDWSSIHIVGTCLDLEKSFLRLTKAPEACTVRPVEVLRKSLVMVKERWRTRPDYFYACDQLKSIRQDLTVQGIRNGFTIEVYETHARIALEKGDHEEFNQCQTQLKSLYADVGGSNRNEFIAYRILYYIFTKNTLDIMTIMKSLSKEEKADPCIGFALKVRSAWGCGNYHKFFKLYSAAPLMAGFLIDWFVVRERKDYLKCIIKSYRQTVTADFLTAELAFKSGTECIDFLEPFSLTFTDGSKTVIDCKSSMTALPNI